MAASGRRRGPDALLRCLELCKGFVAGGGHAADEGGGMQTLSAMTELCNLSQDCLPCGVPPGRACPLLAPLLAGQGALLRLLEEEGGERVARCDCLAASMRLVAAVLKASCRGTEQPDLSEDTWRALEDWCLRLCGAGLLACWAAVETEPPHRLEGCADTLVEATQAVIHGAAFSHLAQYAGSGLADGERSSRDAA